MPASAAEATEIAKEAFVYGFPLVDHYRIQHAYFHDSSNPEHKGEMNVLHSTARVYTPNDIAVQTPNSDTPYSMMGMDLRAEPLVLTVPVIEEGRYFSIQLVDNYTHNFDYIGSRTTGNDGGSFMVAGPGWNGEKPKRVKAIFHCETTMAFAIYRTQLFNPEDIENVKKIQAGYKVETLSSFMGEKAPSAAPKIEWTKPLSPDEQKTSLDFYRILNFTLQFCPTHPSEKELMAKFAKIGVGAGLPFDPASLSAETSDTLKAGMKQGLGVLAEMKRKIDTKEITSGDCFGTREFLKNDYAKRMIAAAAGIYGNTAEEAMYPMYTVDSDGDTLDASKHSYRLHATSMPPVKAFWSLTMYRMPESLLVANPINRYLLNSTMKKQFARDEGEGVTFYVQKESPGKDKEPNWLPAPDGPFLVVLRLYWPEMDKIKAGWKQPELKKSED